MLPVAKLYKAFEAEAAYFEVEAISGAVIFVKNKYRLRILFTCLLLAMACTQPYKQLHPQQFRADSAQVVSHIINGNSVYEKRSGYEAFTNSMEHYDSAYRLALNTGDTFLLAIAYFAKGRAYDAWNKEPQKTIEHYRLAAAYYRHLPGRHDRYLYLQHLVAHAYDKVQDSANAIATLTGLYNTIVQMPDTARQRLPFVPEMALISTEINNYRLATNILQQLTRRPWITNDPGTYNYLDHYYLTQSRIAVYADKNYHTPYLDSLAVVYHGATNLSDSIYYSDELKKLYRAAGNNGAYEYFDQLHRQAFFKMNDPASVVEAQRRINRIENAAVQREMQMVKERSQTRKILTLALAAVVLIISTLLFFLVRRNRDIYRKRQQLAVANKALHEKSLQNELLNKEIHHRVKNNLQMIMSLVYMQERHAAGEEAKDNLQNIRLRIESIAELHRQLMEHDGPVELKAYVQQLVRAATSLLGSGSPVITHLEIAPLSVSQKISFPLGLVLNEWITNSVKHAQTAHDALEIFVHISAAGDHIHIHYHDSGVPQATPTSAQSLGLHIVQLLCSQLGATLQHDDDNHFAYHLTIPGAHA